jgi:hypothetical protein
MPDQRAATLQQQVRGRAGLFRCLSLAGPLGTVAKWLPGRLERAVFCFPKR